MRERSRKPDEIAQDRAIGVALRAIRVERGLSQQKVADDSGITFQQLQKYESGRNRISVSRLYTVLRTMGVRPPDFLREIDHDPLSGVVGAPLLGRATDRQALDLIRAFQAMQPEQRAALSRLAKVIVTGTRTPELRTPAEARAALQAAVE